MIELLIIIMIFGCVCLYKTIKKDELDIKNNYEFIIKTLENAEKQFKRNIKKV